MNTTPIRSRLRSRRLATTALVVVFGGIGSFSYAMRASAGVARPDRTTALPMPTQSTPTAIRAGHVVVSPAPGTHTASVSTQLSFLGPGASATTLRGLRVSGSVTGVHAGRLENYVGAHGASFLPQKPFAPGETVTVHSPVSIVGQASRTYSFVIGNRQSVVGEVHHHYRTTGPDVLRFPTHPNDAPSVVTVHATASTRNEGDIFAAPKGAAGQPGPMIVSPGGRLIWFHRLSDPNEYAMSFSEQHYAGQPVLTWWQGQIVAAHGRGEDVIYNNRYQKIATITGGNGFEPDLHDIEITGKTIWVTSYQSLHWNLTSVGGLPDGLVWDGIVQEIDIKTGLVMFEWHSLDHVPVDWSYFHTTKTPTGRLDYFHVNSIDPLSSNEIVVSSRNTSAFYDVSVADGGKVQYVVGGKHSTYKLGPGVRFNLQHDVRVRSGGDVTIFDNNATPVYGQSKALTIHLDPATKTATLVQAILHHPPLIGAALGDVQVLPDHNLFVDWGTTKYFDEYSPSGQLLFEGTFAGGDDSYKAFRAPWSATPAAPPRVALVRAASGAMSAVATWNGATGVARWQVLTGPTPAHLRVRATVARRGFATSIPLGTLRAGDVVELRALDSKGHVLRATVASP